MPVLTEKTLLAFLQSHFDERADHITLLGAGMFSQAFSFVVGESQYAVRVSECLEDFQKDAFARAHFASALLPIPPVIRTERFDETRYACVTERCAGKTLKDNNNADDAQVVPHLFDVLDAIHSIDVSGSCGWGLDVNGNGRFASWEESLLAFYNQKFDYDWDALARKSFFDAGLFDEFLAEMKRLLPYCSSRRYLIHRDFGFDNVVADGEHVTGVLDWAEFGYGDFLYDVAYLDYYSQEIPYGDLWCARSGTIPYFQERMQCYMLNIGLHSLGIAGTLNDKRAFTRESERMKSVLLPTRRAPTDWTQEI